LGWNEWLEMPSEEIMDLAKKKRDAAAASLWVESLIV
jgi:hypothetical protein